MAYDNSSDKEHHLLFQTAFNILTGEYVVPSASGKIDEGQRFYDATKDKGNLVCPECKIPHIGHREAKPSTGGRIVRDHFAKLNDKAHAGEKHDPHCEIGVKAAKLKSPERSIDKNLGPFFYLNTETPDPVHPHGGRPTQRAWANKSGFLPDHIVRIQYARNTFLKNNEILTSEFVRRERIDPATDVQSLIRNFAIAHENPNHRRDSWALVNGVAIRLDKLFIRAGMKSDIRDLSPEATSQTKEAEGLPNGFRLPEDKKFDRFARIFNEDHFGIHYPVLLHFKVASAPSRKGTPLAPKMIVKIGEYQLERLVRKELDLPTQTVEMAVHVKDYRAFGQLKVGQEFFALAHPYRGTYGNRLTQDFNVNRACDLIPMTLEEFREYLENPQGRKKTGSVTKLLGSIPA